MLELLDRRTEPLSLISAVGLTADVRGRPALERMTGRTLEQSHTRRETGWDSRSWSCRSGELGERVFTTRSDADP